MNKFGALLKNLMDITNTKSKEISSITLYDPSYVSKWINGKTLPSKEDIDLVIEGLSKYFCNKISELGKETEFSHLWNKYPTFNKKTLLYTIMNLFYKSYYKSNGLKISEIKDGADLICEPTNVFRQSVKYTCQQLILNNDKEVDLYVCVNILDMFSKGDIDSYVFNRDVGKSLNVNMMFKKLDFRNWRDNKYSYISILFSFLMYNTNIYYEGDFYDDSFVYFKDNGLISYKIDRDGFAYCMKIIENDYILNKMKYICQSQFNDKNLVYKSSNNIMIENAALTNLHIYDEPIYMLISFYSWIFLSDEFIDSLVESERISQGCAKHLKNNSRHIRSLLDTGKEINIICNFDSIFYSSNNKTTYFMMEKAKLKKNEYRDYCNNISEFINKYPNLKVYSMSSFKHLQDMETYGLNILISNKEILVKKNREVINKNDDMYGEVLDKKIIDRIYSDVKESMEYSYITPMNGSNFYRNCMMYID